MPNTRIGERLSKVSERPIEDRSQELPALTKKFQNFVKGFKPLTETLKEHYDAMKTLEKTQVKVIGQLAEWSKNSPLDEGEGFKIVNVQNALLQRNHEYAEAFMSDVVTYVHEWEIVVTTRIEAGLKQVKELRQNLDHYEKKVGSLEKQKSAVLSRQKVPDEKSTDKLKRNDEKLIIAENEYKFHVHNLCNLIDEAVECCWKDVHPLIFRMMTLEGDRLGDGAAILSASGVIDRLNAIADAYELDLTKPPPSEASLEEKRASSEEGATPSDGEKENAPEDDNEKGEPVKSRVKERGESLKQELNDSTTDEDDEPKKAAAIPSRMKERGEPLEEV